VVRSVVLLAISLALTSCGYPQPADVPGPDAATSSIDADQGVDSGDPDVDAMLSSAKELTSFSFLASNNPGLSTNVVGTVVGSNITAAVPFDASVGALVASYATTGNHITVAGATQVNGVTANDFGSAVTYSVVADDGTVRAYTVTVTEQQPPLSFAPKADFATANDAHDVATADLNGDGKLDLVVANAAANNLSVFLGTTTPGAASATFATRVDFVTGISPRSVAVADFNRDGRPDVAVVNTTSGTASVFLDTTTVGGSTPTFSTRVDLTTGIAPISVAAGDLNGDGSPDLAVANLNSNSVSILLNSTAAGAAAPAFAAKVDFSTGTGPAAIALGDLNGDGRLDVVVANLNSDTASVLLDETAPGAATPAFAAKVDFAAGDGPNGIALADINGDGKQDLAIANTNAGTASVLLGLTAAGATTPSFSPKADFATGAGAYAVAVADLNGDGVVDLAVPNGTSNTVSILLGSTPPGATAAAFAAAANTVTGMPAVSVALDDFNGDGKSDVAVVNGTSSNTISVLLNTSAWGRALDYAPPVNLPTGNQTHAIAAGDLNGDGRKDLVEVNADTNDLSILFNTTPIGATTASFAARVTFGAGVSPRSVSLGDLNGDGRLDVVFASSTSQTISAYLNLTPAGATTPTLGSQTDFTAGAAPLWMTLGDFNTDGKLDIAVGNYNAGNLSVLLGTTPPGATTPTFATHVAFTTGMMPIMVAVGDLNGDGKPDLAAANFGSDTVSVLLSTTAAGASTPTFATKVDFAAGTNPQSVVIGDVNRDGKRDLAITNYESDDVSVLRNTTATGAATPTFATKVDFTAADQPYSSAIADVDADGIPDLIIPSVGAGVVSILRGTTSAGSATLTFAAKVDFTTGATSVMPVVADLNGDGRADLAVANGLPADTVTILLAD